MNQHSPTVYVVQDTRKNIVSALDYGQLVAVLDEHDEARMLNIPQITFKIKHKLQRMQPTDYLLLIGSPIAIAIAGAVAADVCGGRFRLLKWDNQDNRYFPVSVDINRLEDKRNA